MIASCGNSLNCLSCLMIEEIVEMHTSVFMFVYIETASAVNRRHPGGSSILVSMGCRTSLLLK